MRPRRRATSARHAATRRHFSSIIPPRTGLGKWTIRAELHARERHILDAGRFRAQACDYAPGFKLAGTPAQAEREARKREAPSLMTTALCISWRRPVPQECDMRSDAATAGGWTHPWARRLLGWCSFGSRVEEASLQVARAIPAATTSGFRHPLRCLRGTSVTRT
jgi:hypothetical protein